MKKSTYIWLIVGLFVLGAILLRVGMGKISWVVQIFYWFVLIFTTRTYNKKQNQDLDEMWALADRLGKTSEDLKNYGNLGLLDLEATRRNSQGERGFYPSRRSIRKIVDNLKKEAE